VLLAVSNYDSINYRVIARRASKRSLHG